MRFLLGSRQRRDVLRRAEDARFEMGLQSMRAWGALGRSDFSAAATACHRAHQFELIAQALELAAQK